MAIRLATPGFAHQVSISFAQLSCLPKFIYLLYLNQSPHPIQDSAQYSWVQVFSIFSFWPLFSFFSLVLVGCAQPLKSPVFFIREPYLTRSRWCFFEIEWRLPECHLQASAKLVSLWNSASLRTFQAEGYNRFHLGCQREPCKLTAGGWFPSKSTGCTKMGRYTLSIPIGCQSASYRGFARILHSFCLKPAWIAPRLEFHISYGQIVGKFGWNQGGIFHAP